MMRRTIRSILRVLPPVWTIATFLSCYFAVWGLAEFFRNVLSDLPPDTFASLLKPFLVTEMGTVAVGAALFAFWRIHSLHPIVNWEYRQWLERTPWTPDRPLPMGSVLPGAADVVVVAVLCWMSGDVWWFSCFMPLLGYLVVLIVLSCIILGFTRQRAVLYSLLFALGFAIRLAANPLFSVLILAAALPLVLLGLKRSLDPKRWPDYALSLQKLSTDAKPVSKELGWPFGYLGPKPAPCLVCWPDTLAISLLIGWFLHALLSHADPREVDEHGMVGFGVVLAGIIALCRVVGYTVKHSAPISPLGRLLTGRWIIPRYDRVFVASIWAILAVLVAEVLIESLAVPAAVGQPAVAALFAFVLLAIGPSYRNWQLTGGHRINPANIRSKAGSYLEV